MSRFPGYGLAVGLAVLLSGAAGTASAAPIAEEGRAEIGGAAVLTAERQASLIAAAALRPPRERAGEVEDFDAEEFLDAHSDSAFDSNTERSVASAKPMPMGADEFLEGGVPTRESGAVQTLAQTPAPINAFTANRGDGSLAADTSIAVSYTHVIVTNRNQIGYYSKAGRNLATLSVDTLFAGLKLVNLFGVAPQYHDMHCLYDAYRGRFWVGAIAFKDAGPVRKLSKFVVAVSKTNSPLDGWNLYWWDAIPGDGHPGLNGNHDGDASDYPSWGIDNFGVYQTNPFCRTGPPRDCSHQQLTFFPAAPLAAGAASLPVGWLFWDLKNPDGTIADGIIQPALHHGSSFGSTFFVSTENPKVIVWRLRNHLTVNQALENVAVPVTSFDRPTADRASQKGSSDTIWLANLGNSALKAVYRNGKLYASFNDAAPWFTPSFLDASIRLIRMDVSQFPTVTPTVDRYFGGNSGFYDQPNDRISYAFPAVEVNKNGDMVVVYGRAGLTIYPEVFYSVYPAAGPDIQPSRRLRQGDAAVEASLGPLVQLHDFDGASVDPFDDTAVWMAAPYGESHSFRASENWAIAVGKVLGTLVPDFILESVSASVKPTGIAVTVGVRNQGDKGAPASTLGFFLLPLHGGGLIKLGTAPCKSLISDAYTNVIATFPRPPGLANGSYILKAVADYGDKVLEYSGANNGASAGAVLVLK